MQTIEGQIELKRSRPRFAMLVATTLQFPIETFEHSIYSYTESYKAFEA